MNKENVEKTTQIDENGYIIYGWMVEDLKLCSPQVQIYAIIHKYSIEQDKLYTKGISYLTKYTGYSKPAIINHLKKMVKKNLIDKRVIYKNNVRLCYYSVYRENGECLLPFNRYLDPDFKFAKGSTLEENIKLLQEENKTNRELKKQILNMEYKNFLRTPYWKTIAMYLKSKHHFCTICHSDKALRVHHSTYVHHGEEALHLEDLVVLCNECHKKFHGIKNNKEEK